MMDTVVLPLLGGALIGVAASAFLLLNGRIAGISGILGGALGRPRGEMSWRLAFLAGLVVGGAALAVFRPESFPSDTGTPAAQLIAAGLLVGFGTQMGSGCTSGHGVCGLGRMSPRSLAATLTFIAAGAVTVLLVRVLGGGA